MKVDIIGHGYVPGLKDVIAPLKGYEADESFVRRMLNFPDEWRVYDSESGLLITQENVDNFFGGGSGGGGSVSWKFLDDPASTPETKDSQ